MKESWPRGEDGLFLATLIWYGENQSPSRSWPLVVSSGLAHHVHKGHQGVVSCLPPLTTCPLSTLWRTQEQDWIRSAEIFETGPEGPELEG